MNDSTIIAHQSFSKTMQAIASSVSLAQSLLAAMPGMYCEILDEETQIKITQIQDDLYTLKDRLFRISDNWSRDYMEYSTACNHVWRAREEFNRETV